MTNEGKFIFDRYSKTFKNGQKIRQVPALSSPSKQLQQRLVTKLIGFRRFFPFFRCADRKNLQKPTNTTRQNGKGLWDNVYLTAKEMFFFGIPLIFCLFSARKFPL